MVDQEKNKMALLLVDIQNDFCTGALPVPGAEEIAPEINRLIAYVQQRQIPIIASRDWHPANHCSFVENGGQWPAHCIAGSQGADWHKAINPQHIDITVNKAYQQDLEQYSAISGVINNTNISLQQYLKKMDIKTLIVCGLALDYCVYHTVIEAQNNGINCKVILSACREINADKAQDCKQAMQRAGAQLYTDLKGLELT